MKRFYVPPECITGEEATIPEEQRKHIENVLRLKPGAEILVFDGNGKEYKARIKTLYPSISCHIICPSPNSTFDRVNITLVQGIAKGEKMDLIIQKCTEIGISTFIPCLTERTIIKLDKAGAAKKRERWQKIVRSATEQSYGTIVPEVTEVRPFNDVIKGLSKQSLNLIPWEEEKCQSIKQVLRKADSREITVFIGPEGGFSEQEVQAAREYGAIPVSLGRRILRTETAGLVAAAIIKYELDL